MMRSERAGRTDSSGTVATWDPLPFDADAARAYARVFAASRAAGRSSRARVADLLIAATAAANGLALYTHNPGDFTGLERVVRVVSVRAATTSRLILNADPARTSCD